MRINLLAIDTIVDVGLTNNLSLLVEPVSCIWELIFQNNLSDLYVGGCVVCYFNSSTENISFRLGEQCIHH